MTEATQTTDQEEYVSALDMSDEEYLAQDPELPDEVPEYDEPVIEPETPDADEPTEDGEDGDAPADPDAASEDGDGGEVEETEPGSDTDPNDTDADDPDAKKDDEPGDDTAVVDYEAEYARLMAPFQANGKQMQVENVDEAIQLMQMGANYNKKMAALKPSLKTLRLLDKHNLNDESKLSYLIDLDLKNPEAIRKLVKESGIDPLEMDVETDSDYEPERRTVDDKEMALEDVLESIQDSTHYTKVVQLVSNTWDSRSQKVVADNPQLLTMINDHMASGVYDRVSEVVEKERTFGRLNGLSDLEAYDKVGEQLSAKGAFNDLFGAAEQSAEPPARREVPPPKKPVVDPAIKDKKRAASSTKPKPPSETGLDDLNPLALSDEEYEKRFSQRFI